MTSSITLQVTTNRLASLAAFLALILSVSPSHAVEPDIRAQVKNWADTLTAASPLNNPVSMVQTANVDNPAPSNRADLLGAVAAAAATKARLFQWYGNTPTPYLTDAKTYLMAIVDNYTTAKDVSFFAPYTMMAAYEILDANGQFTQMERDKVRDFTAGRFVVAALENHPDTINNAYFTRAAGLRKASNLLPSATGVATWNTFASDFWSKFIALEDVPENATTYLGISSAYAWLLADELGQASALNSSNIRAFHTRLRNLVTPAGAMPAYGDSFLVNQVGGAPNNLWPVTAEWTYYVAAFERAATVFGDASFRAAARAIYDSGVAREPMTGNYRNMQSLYVLSQADLWRNTALTPAAVALGTQLLTKRYRDTLTSPIYQAADKIILSPSRVPGQPYAMIDVFPPDGWHSHVNQQGAIGYYQKDNIPLLTALDGNSRGPDSISTLLLRPGATTDFPVPAAYYEANTWRTIYMPLANIRTVGPAGSRDYQNLKLRLAVPANTTTALTVDNLRLVGPAGTLAVEAFESTAGWSFGSSSGVTLGVKPGSPGNANGMEVTIANTSAVGSAYFISKNFPLTTVDLSNYKYLAIDWKISNTAEPARPFIFRVDTIAGGNTLLSDFLAQDLQLGPVKTANPVAVGTAGGFHYGDVRFGEYFTSATTTTRRVAMDARGVMLVRDELAPGSGLTATNTSADGQNSGPIWLLGATGTPETGTRWVDSARDPAETSPGAITDLFVYMNSPASPVVGVQTLTAANSPRVNARLAYARQTLTGGAPVRFTSVLIPHDPAVSGATINAGLTVQQSGTGSLGTNGAIGYSRATYTLGGTIFRLMQNVLWDSVAASAVEIGDWDGPLAISARSTDATLRTTPARTYVSTDFSSDAADALVEHRYGELASWSALSLKTLTLAGQPVISANALLDAGDLDYTGDFAAPATGLFSSAVANSVTVRTPDSAFSVRIDGATVASTLDTNARTRQFAIPAGGIHRAALADSALATRWAFDETGGTIAVDYTSLHDATLLNGASIAAGGRTGAALLLDGVDDVARYNGATGISGYPFTLSVWIRTSTATADMTALALLKASSDSVHWEIGVKNGLPRLIARNTTKYEYLGTASVADGQWHQLTGVFASATSRTLYVDGALAASGTDNVAFDSGVNRIAAGRLERINPVSAFSGSLDDVRLYTRALAPPEVVFPVLHWKLNELSGTSSTSSFQPATGVLRNGAAFAPATGRFGGAATFDGVDDNIRYDGATVTAYPFTLSAWVKTSVNTNAGMSALSLLKGSAVATHWDIGVINGKARLIGRNTTRYEAIGTTVITDGQWHQITGIFESATLRKLYVDGVPEATGIESVPFDSTADRISAGLVDRPGPADPFLGSLDDLRVYRGSVLPFQITAP